MQEWDGTEAQALEDSGYEVELDPACQDEEQIEGRRNERNSLLQMRYKADRSAKVGSTIYCPVCNKPHVKTTYHKVFCRNQKTMKKHVSSCKDRYWNMVNPRGLGAF